MELQKALHVVTGQEIPIFQDNSDIAWGDRWKERIDGALDDVSALIVVLSPSFFASEQCCRELHRFLDREHKIDRQDLLLPIYWVSSPLINTRSKDHRLGGEMAARLGGEMAARQYADCRDLRLKLPASPEEPISAPINHFVEMVAHRLQDAFWPQSPDSSLQSTEMDKDKTGDHQIVTASPDRVAEELPTLTRTLKQLEATFRDGAALAVHALERFVDPEGLLELADSDFLTDDGLGLRPWLADLEAAVAGHHVDTAAGIRRWQELAAEVAVVAKLLVEANGKPDRRCSELAGLLTTYRAMARERGLIEDADLTTLHTAALDTLRRVPTDLRLADRQVAAYVQAVISQGDM